MNPTVDRAGHPIARCCCGISPPFTDAHPRRVSSPQILALGPSREQGDTNGVGFVTVGSDRELQPLDCFTTPGIDFASVVVSFPWAQRGLNAPRMTAAVDFRLVEDNGTSQRVERFGAGRRSTTAWDVKRKVRFYSSVRAGRGWGSIGRGCLSA